MTRHLSFASAFVALGLGVATAAAASPLDPSRGAMRPFPTASAMNGSALDRSIIVDVDRTGSIDGRRRSYDVPVGSGYGRSEDAYHGPADSIYDGWRGGPAY